MCIRDRSEEDKLVVARARKIQRFLSQPFFVAEVFTGSPGKYVSLKDTIRGLSLIHIWPGHSHLAKLSKFWRCWCYWWWRWRF